MSWCLNSVLRLGKANYCFVPVSSWWWHLWELTRVVCGVVKLCEALFFCEVVSVWRLEMEVRKEGHKAGNPCVR